MAALRFREHVFASQIIVDVIFLRRGHLALPQLVDFTLSLTSLFGLKHHISLYGGLI